MSKILNKKYLAFIFVLFTVLLMFGNTVFAELSVNPSVGGTIVTSVIDEIGKVGLNLANAGLAIGISGLAVILYVILQIVFVASSTTQNILQFPYPDNIIFNKMELFDANFINPHASSATVTYAIRSTISSIYDSFVIIAIAAFTIVAMIIGIKLAISTIASFPMTSSILEG